MDDNPQVDVKNRTIFQLVICGDKSEKICETTEAESCGTNIPVNFCRHLPGKKSQMWMSF